MGRDCSKASGNVYFEARKAAAEYDDRLYSREKAAELMAKMEEYKKAHEFEKAIALCREVIRPLTA